MPQPISDARCRPITPPNRMQRAPAGIPNQATCAFGVACSLHEEQAGGIHMLCTTHANCPAKHSLLPRSPRIARQEPQPRGTNKAQTQPRYATVTARMQYRHAKGHSRIGGLRPKPKAQKRAAQAPSMHCAVAWNRPIALLLSSAAICCYLRLVICAARRNPCLARQGCRRPRGQ